MIDVDNLPRLLALYFSLQNGQQAGMPFQYARPETETS